MGSLLLIVAGLLIVAAGAVLGFLVHPAWLALWPLGGVPIAFGLGSVLGKRGWS